MYHKPQQQLHASWRPQYWGQIIVFQEVANRTTCSRAYWPTVTMVTGCTTVTGIVPWPVVSVPAVPDATGRPGRPEAFVCSCCVRPPTYAAARCSAAQGS